eukprot:6212739-Pleurochrysis_carterae.AAC.1
MSAQSTFSWPLVLDSLVGTLVKDSHLVGTEAVAVHIYKLSTCQHLDRVDARASGRAIMPAVYIALTSVQYNERVSQPSEKRSSAWLLHYFRKGRWEGWRLWGHEGGGLVDDLRFCVNYSAALIRNCAICPLLRQRLGCCSAGTVISVPLSETIFEPVSQHTTSAAAAQMHCSPPLMLVESARGSRAKLAVVSVGQTLCLATEPAETSLLIHT